MSKKGKKSHNVRVARIEKKITAEITEQMEYIEEKLNECLGKVIDEMNLDLTDEERSDAMVTAREVFFKG